MTDRSTRRQPSSRADPRPFEQAQSRSSQSSNTILRFRSLPGSARSSHRPAGGSISGRTNTHGQEPPLRQERARPIHLTALYRKPRDLAGRRPPLRPRPQRPPAPECSAGMLLRRLAQPVSRWYCLCASNPAVGTRAPGQAKETESGERSSAPVALPPAQPKCQETSGFDKGLNPARRMTKIAHAGPSFIVCTIVSGRGNEVFEFLLPPFVEQCVPVESLPAILSAFSKSMRVPFSCSFLPENGTPMARFRSRPEPQARPSSPPPQSLHRDSANGYETPDRARDPDAGFGEACSSVFSEHTFRLHSV